MQPAITIGGVRVKPGTRATIQLPVARLYTSTAMTMPVHVIHGRQEGPRLFVSGAIHGDEIIGTEIIRRLARLKRTAKLRGTLLAVPVVNVYAFVHLSRYSPDRRDLNRFFPGSDRGSLTSQLADTFMEGVVKGCDYGLDLHAGSNHRANLPQIRADLEDPEILSLAKAFRVPVAIHSTGLDNSLRKAAAQVGVRCLLYEAGEALRFDDVAIRAGLRGVLSVMAAIGMLKPAKRVKPPMEPLISNSTSWVRAPASGILHMTKPLGGRVTKNTKIGLIADPFGQSEINILSPASGMVIGNLKLPLVHQGDAVIHIAHLEKLKSIGPVIGDFREDIDGGGEDLFNG